MEQQPYQLKIVVLAYNDLLQKKDLSASIQQAYGPHGHGILFVQGIPSFEQIKKKVLLLIHKLGNQPENVLKKLQCPEIFHSRGWSHGVEKFEGIPDISKGSFYFNGVTDEAYVPQDPDLFSQEEKKFFVPNIWIDTLPQIKQNVQILTKLMIQVGSLLALQIDRYAKKQIPTYHDNKLYNIIKNGRGHIGRLLHYYPFEELGTSEDDWCGWHNDHGALTALTPALYTDEEGQQTNISITSGGLYAKNRQFEKVRVAIPKNMLAFQLGESAQILTGGKLQATPHCVVRSPEIAGEKISRNTIALFMQPDFLEEMSVPEGIDQKNVTDPKAYKVAPLKERWENKIKFKEFNRRTLQKYSTKSQTM